MNFIVAFRITEGRDEGQMDGGRERDGDWRCGFVEFLQTFQCTVANTSATYGRSIFDSFSHSHTQHDVWRVPLSSRLERGKRIAFKDSPGCELLCPVFSLHLKAEKEKS